MSDRPLVYVLDDDNLVVESLSHSLRHANYSVASFSSPKEFLNQTINSEHACLILDLNMPGHSGLQIQRELKNRGCNIPIIIYSGAANVSEAVAAMQEGAVTLLQKPVAIEKLCKTIDKALAKQEKTRHQREQIKQAAEKLARLTKREAVIAKMVSDGYSAAEIAEELYISSRTVEAHKSNIFQKAEVRSIAQLTQITMLAEREHV